MRKKRLTLKQTYNLIFFCLIVVPLILVFAVSLVILSRKYKQQAVENIERAQDTVVTEFLSDVDFMSIRLSQLINANDGEILNYAAKTDTDDSRVRYEYQKKLENAGNLMLEPVRDIVSVAFYMKDGREDLLVLNYGISPNRLLDRSGQIEMVAFYQVTDVGDTIRGYNRNYEKGQNRLGIMQITDSGNHVIYATKSAPKKKKGYTCVKTPINFNGMQWYVESYIRTKELTEEFNRTGIAVLLTAVVILALAGYFAEYFIKTVVRPVEEISAGLKQVEDGKLDLHITPVGQVEIREVIHRFNAMVRSLRALVDDYEKQVKKAGKTPGDYFAAMIKKEMTPEEVDRVCREFFQDSYAVIGMYFETAADGRMNLERVHNMMEGFEKNPRFTARCIYQIESPVNGYIFYRISEEEYLPRIKGLFGELQAYAGREHGIVLDIFIGRKCFGACMFTEALEEVRSVADLRFLYGGNALLELESGQDDWKGILGQAGEGKAV